MSGATCRESRRAHDAGLDAGEAGSDGSGRERGDPFPWLAAGFALLHFVFGLLVFEPTLFPGGDNAGYLILGEALRGGDGYRDLYLPGSPLHAKYPPLLPALLAVLGSFGGVQVAKVAMLVLTSLSVWVVTHFGRRWVGTAPALVAGAVLALNPTLLEYGHYVLSEAPFVLLVLLALWASQRDDGRGAALAMAAAVGAFATRSAGMTILAAVPLAWLVARRYRRAAIGAAVAIVTLVLWGAYQRWAAPSQPSYLAELLLVDPYDPGAGRVGIAGLVARAAANLWAYVGRVIPQTAVGTGAQGGVLLALFGIALTGLALAGWARRARDERLGAPELFVLLYGGLIAVWPSVWTDRRFLLPLLPLLVLLAASFLARLGDRWRRWAPIGVVVAIGVPSMLWLAERAPIRLECAASYRAGRPCDPPANASFYAAARWAAENTPEGTIIANRKPRLFWWYARRQGDLYPYSTDPSAVMQGLERMGADYVVVDQISGTTGRYLVPAIQAFQTRFEPAYQGGTPSTFILRLRPEPSAAE